MHHTLFLEPVSACACQPAYLWAYVNNLLISVCSNSFGCDWSISWWEKWREWGSVAYRAGSSASASQSQQGQRPAGSKRVINIMWRQQLSCVQQKDRKLAGKRQRHRSRRRRRREGKVTLSTKDRRRKKENKGQVVSENLFHISPGRYKNHLSSHNVKPKILLPFTQCRSSPASTKHTREIQ